MSKIFSTKLDAKLLQLLDRFCKKYHLKKSSLVGEILKEGIERKKEALELAESLKRGLQDEREGNFYTAQEIEKSVFGIKKVS